MTAVFLDRDGTLNHLVYYPDTGEYESPRVPDDLELMEDIVDPLQRLQCAGWKLFIVSNQPSYAKQKTTLESLQAIHARLDAFLKAYQIAFTDYYYCYCHPQGSVPGYTGECDCRKPKPGMLLKARDRYGLDLSVCWMIGDQDADVLCGQAAGCRTIQLEYPPSRSKRGQAIPDWRCLHLSDAIDHILYLSKSRKSAQ